MTRPDETPRSPSVERNLFALALCLNLALHVWLVADRRIVQGHDTFVVYAMQNFSVTNAAQAGEPPLWYPYVAHGIVSTWSLGVQGGLFQGLLMELGGLLSGANFIPLFYAGVFVDEFLLLLGIWLLGRRYGFSPATLFFTAVAAIGSCLWTDQIFFNLRLIVAVPLVLWLFHGFRDSGSRVKLYLALNLLILQFVTNLSYVAALTVFVVAVYLVVWMAIFRNREGSFMTLLRPRAADALGLACTLAVAALVFVAISRGAERIAGFMPDRNPDGTAPLDVFLTYGGYLTPTKYLDALFGLAAGPDVFVYCGFLTLGFAVLALFHRPGHPVLHLAVCLILVIHLSTGFMSVVSMAAYHFPAMDYYRHLGLAVPFARLFLILLAGHGFQAVLAAPMRSRWPIRSVSTLFLGVAAGLGGSAVLAITGWLDSGLLPDVYPFPRPPASAVLLVPSALAAGVAGILLALLVGRRRAGTILVGAFLAAQAADTIGWKIRMTLLKTIPMDDRPASLQKLEGMPYVASRGSGYASSDRYRAFDGTLFQYGWVHGVCDSWFFADLAESRFRTDYWMKPLEDLRLAAELPLHLPGEDWRITGRPLKPAFDRAGPEIRKIIGSDGEKIQVFARARSGSSTEEITGWITDSEYGGDRLFVLDAATRADSDPLSADDRVECPREVVRFDANSMSVKVEVPDDLKEAWLLYADAWDPGWEAAVNGRPVPVRRGNLAYKAVPLEAGENLVEFRFRDPVRTIALRALHWNQILWLAALAWLAWRLLRRPKPRSSM